MSLYASVLDLQTGGLPTAALSSVSYGTKLYHLTAVSGRYADSVGLRARYTLPLVASLALTSYEPATGTTGTGTITAAITSGTTITEAVGVVFEVLTTGIAGVATGRVSITSGNSWLPSFVITAGTLVLSCGVTLTISSGTYFDGDVWNVYVNFDAVTHAVVKIAAYEILTKRGFNADDAAYDAIKTAYKDAVSFFEKMPPNKVDPGQTDATPSTTENGFLFEPEDWNDESATTRFDFSSMMGRSWP